MPFFTHDGLNFHYLDKGRGTPFVFQHGLGGDVSQPFGIFAPPPGFRLLAFDCRAHGETRPLGEPERIALACFANDLLTFMDHLGLAAAIVGGISMGAAVALNFTLRFPQRVSGLVLSRPAWLDSPMLRNATIYARIAQLIRRYGPERGQELFQQSKEYKEVLSDSPDSANSLIGQFQNPRAAETVIKLERIPNDSPSRDRREWNSIQVPTLVLASRQDPIHPFEFGEILAREIPGAEFKELTPKSVSRDRHAAEVQEFVGSFLRRRFAVA
jgi:pimeloyl-ACP methyl ester carboxylesterase